MAKKPSTKQVKFGKKTKNVNNQKWKKVKESAEGTFKAKRRDLLSQMLESMIDGDQKSADRALSEYMSIRTRQILEGLSDDDKLDGSDEESDLDDAESKLDDVEGDEDHEEPDGDEDGEGEPDGDEDDMEDDEDYDDEDHDSDEDDMK